MAGRGPGHLGPIAIEAIIGEGRDNRRQAADPCNPSFSDVPTATAAPVRATSRNGWLWLTFRHCRHNGDPVFAPTGPRRFGSLVEVAHASSCGSVVVARRCRPLVPEHTPSAREHLPRITFAHALRRASTKVGCQRIAPSVRAA